MTGANAVTVFRNSPRAESAGKLPDTFLIPPNMITFDASADNKILNMVKRSSKGSNQAAPPSERAVSRGAGAKGSATPLPLGVIDSVGGVKSV